MGVPRLFPLLKYSVSRVRFFDLFAGKLFVAVDAFVWLYELISSCAAGRGGWLWPGSWR